MRKMCLFVCLICLVPALAMADGISPLSVSGVLAVGGSVTIHKTVTVSAGAPTAGQGDVFFLADTTGSMGGTIDAVKTNAAAIVAGLAGYGSVMTGAASYKDFPTNTWGSSGDYAYRLDASIDGTASTQAGIGTWSASGGNDTPEAELYALQQLTTDPSWRPGSEKFVLWFGDAPGHEPSNTTGYPGPSTADTLAALQAAGVTVYAFNMASLDAYGQATAITDGTGGQLYDGFGSDIVATIVAAIGSGFSTYTAVGVETPSLAGLGISVVPTSYVGSFDRSVERTFGFDVTFTGLAPGTYDFSLYGTVDGGRVATETDHIVVAGVPDPGATLLLFGMGLAGLTAFRRWRG